MVINDVPSALQLSLISAAIRVLESSIPSIILNQEEVTSTHLLVLTVLRIVANRLESILGSGRRLERTKQNIASVVIPH